MRILIALSLLFAVGCASVDSVSQTSIPKNRKKKVMASVEQNIIFMLNFSNDYVDNLTSQLIAKCEGGEVTGILTKHESVTYFPIIFHKIKVSAQGYCND